jgi:hypothetical protein
VAPSCTRHAPALWSNLQDTPLIITTMSCHASYPSLACRFLLEAADVSAASGRPVDLGSSSGCGGGGGSSSSSSTVKQLPLAPTLQTSSDVGYVSATLPTVLLLGMDPMKICFDKEEQPQHRVVDCMLVKFLSSHGYRSASCRQALAPWLPEEVGDSCCFWLRSPLHNACFLQVFCKQSTTAGTSCTRAVLPA